MKTRLKEIRKKEGLNQTEFGSVIGATQAMISDYETGRVVPDISKRMLICEKFNVNLEWLEHGKGDMYKANLIPQLHNAFKNNPAIAAALELIASRMTVEDWKILNTVVEKAIQQKDEEL